MALGPARQRAVLATLLVEPGATVFVEQLVDRVWGERPPTRARETLHTYLSRLRTVLDGEGRSALVRRSNGYVLEVDPAAVDLHRFRALVGEARSATDDEAVALWRAALALWQGAPFADVDSDWLSLLAPLRALRKLQVSIKPALDVVHRGSRHGRRMAGEPVR